jgi:hypothetical protein
MVVCDGCSSFGVPRQALRVRFGKPCKPSECFGKPSERAGEASEHFGKRVEEAEVLRGGAVGDAERAGAAEGAAAADEHAALD